MGHDDFDPIARRRAKREAAQRMRLLVGATIAGGLLLCTGLVLVVAMLARHNGRPGAGVSLPVVSSLVGPSPTSEGVEWNHKELLTYLASRGLNMTMHPTDTGAFYGPAVDIYRTGDEDSGRVYVQKRKSPQDARDQAGVSGQAFSWGCFLFVTSDQKMASDIRRALGIG